MALNETGPESRYPREGKGRGKCRDVIDEEAMIHVEQRPQLLELSRADRELVCQRQIPASDRARALLLAEELLPRAIWNLVSTRSSPL